MKCAMEMLAERRLVVENSIARLKSNSIEFCEEVIAPIFERKIHDEIDCSMNIDISFKPNRNYYNKISEVLNCHKIDFSYNGKIYHIILEDCIDYLKDFCLEMSVIRYSNGNEIEHIEVKVKPECLK